MKISNVEVYKNGDKWVTAWLDNSSYYPQKTEAFFSKTEANDLAIRLGARECRRCGDVLEIGDDLICGYHNLEN